MNEINENPLSEEQAPEMSDEQEIMDEPEAQVSPEIETEKKEPSKVGRFFRKVLVWLIVIVITFLGGLLTDHFVRYRPLADELKETKLELVDANKDVSDMGAEIIRLTNANQDANDQIVTLEDDLAAATAKLQYFEVLVDVNTARIELFLEDIEAAQAALEDTPQRLEDLLLFVGDVDPELALSLPRRLELIVAGLARDPETGRIDLELFTKDLLELKPFLIGD